MNDMWLFFAMIGLGLAVLGLIALVRGHLERARIRTRTQALIVLAAACLALAASMATNPNLPQPGEAGARFGVERAMLVWGG